MVVQIRLLMVVWDAGDDGVGAIDDGVGEAFDDR